VQSLSIATRYIDGGRDKFVELVQLAMLNGSDDATKWMTVYADLLPSERVRVSFDDVCAAAGVTPSRLVGVVTSTAMDMGRDVGNFVAAITHPQVVAASVNAAKHPDGIEDRKLLFQHNGFIAAPKGTTVNVHASASAAAAAQAKSETSVPSFGGDIASLGAAVQPRAALPAAREVEDLTFDGVLAGDADTLEPDYVAVGARDDDDADLADH